MKLNIHISEAGARLFGSLEAEIMAYFWSSEEAKTIRSVYLDLQHGKDRDEYKAYNTYMTTVHRLANKGILIRSRNTTNERGAPDMYSPAITREGLRQLIMSSLEVIA